MIALLRDCLLAAAFTAALVPAQCSVVSGSGCTPPVPTPVCSGSAGLGQSLAIDMNPGGLPAILRVAALGLPGSPPVRIGPAFGTCSGASCTFVLPPSAVWVPLGALLPLRIPNNPALLGTTLWAQAALGVGFLGSGTCLVLPPAVAFTIR